VKGNVRGEIAQLFDFTPLFHTLIILDMYLQDQNPPPKKYRDILGGELWVFFPKFSGTAQA